jgi:hypothetical protein
MISSLGDGAYEGPDANPQTGDYTPGSDATASGPDSGPYPPNVVRIEGQTIIGNVGSAIKKTVEGSSPFGFLTGTWLGIPIWAWLAVGGLVAWKHYKKTRGS